MAQRQWRSDDTDKWLDAFSNGSSDITKSADETASLPNATCTGTATQYTLSLGSTGGFSNGDIVVIHQTQKATGFGVWELNKIASGAGSTSLTLSYQLMNTYAAGAQIVGFIKAKNFTINSTKTVTVPAWTGSVAGIYPVIANGDITITGNIVASGATGSGTTAGATGGFRGGTGRSTSGAAEYADGTIGNRATAGSAAANGNGGGGGKALATVANEGPGGTGGHATAGAAGSGNGAQWNGAGGGTAGAANLTTMVFGGGGGGGTAVAGRGGSSGGGIVILIGKTITVSGTIYSKGGNGQGTYGSGGAGAGGSILLKGKTISIGTNLVRADGGTGAGDNNNPGGTGRIHADYSTSLTGTTTPTIDSTNDPTIKENTGGAFLLNLL